MLHLAYGDDANVPNGRYHFYVSNKKRLPTVYGHSTSKTISSANKVQTLSLCHFYISGCNIFLPFNYAFKIRILCVHCSRYAHTLGKRLCSESKPRLACVCSMCLFCYCPSNCCFRIMLTNKLISKEKIPFQKFYIHRHNTRRIIGESITMSPSKR